MAKDTDDQLDDLDHLGDEAEDEVTAPAPEPLIPPSISAAPTKTAYEPFRW
ncbi:hypothetical protein PP713_13975 [Mycobacterium sp. CSUR Q5927]|nr:hypothetical protein [Mycobacterium sp. CSUR Q5927]